MDETTFDRVVRAVGSGGSRRRLLGVVGGLSFAAVLGRPCDDTEAAKQHDPNRGHRPGKNKDNRKGKRTGNGNGDAFGLSDDQCAATLTKAGCTQQSSSDSTSWTCPLHADLSGANLQGCDLTGANLRTAIIDGANLQQVNLSNADLQYAEFRKTDLTGARFVGATLQHTIFVEAKLINVKFGSGPFGPACDCTGADFAEADLSDADLRGMIGDHYTDVSNAVCTNTTCPDGTNSSTNGTWYPSCCNHWGTAFTAVQFGC